MPQGVSLDAGHPHKHEKGPTGTKRSGSVLKLYGSDADPGSAQKTPESGLKNPDPEAFALSFDRIRGSGLSPDPESFCVSV